MKDASPEIVQWITRDVSAGRLSSPARWGLAVVYFGCPLFFLWQLGVWDLLVDMVLPTVGDAAESGITGPLNALTAIAFLLSGVGLFGTFSSSRIFKLNGWLVVVGVVLMLGASVPGRMAQGGFAWWPPEMHDWSKAWHCALLGLLLGLSACLLMLIALFPRGSLPTARHRLIIAAVSSALGLFVQSVYCPLDDVFHLSVGHLGEGLAALVTSWLTATVVFNLVLRFRLGRLGIRVRGLSRLG